VFNRRHVLAAGAAAAATAAVSAKTAFAAPASPAEAQLNKLMDDFFAESLIESPQLCTSLGVDKGAHAAAKGKLDQSSIAYREHQVALNADQMKRLHAIDRKQLTGMAVVNYDTIDYGVTTSAEADRSFKYGAEGGGQPYAISQLTGSYHDTPDFLANQHVIETKTDCDAYLSRLEAFATVLDQETERARRDHAMGVIPPDFCVAGAIGQLNGLKGPPEKSTLVISLVDRAKEKGIAGDYGAQAAKIYSDKILPALDRQIALMEGAKAKAVHDAGVWRLPDGAHYYELALQGGTTTKMTAAEVHQLGLDQAKSLGARADVLFKQIGMSQGTVGERYKALYAETKYRYPNTDAGKEKLIADLNVLVQKMQARLPTAFGALPKAPLKIQRVPKFIEAGAPGGYYNTPSLDGSRPGIYWINLRDTAEVPSWTLPTLTYHEGIPGHHLQLSLQQEADLPMLRRVIGYSSYSEGWALYAEQLAQEMGAYQGDPQGELGYLHDALFRAARLVVDTGLHAMKWSREQAIKTMCDIDGDPETAAATEIDRYCVWPGQACSYMVGKLTWLRLREKAKTQLGAKFDIRKFHDAGLLAGGMPLTVLDLHINEWLSHQA
jgi:uncharacterized protein (DUF885 family)